MPCLSATPLDATRLAAQVASPDRGAVVTFIGLVRDHHAGRSVVSLVYTAYGPMAEAVAEEVIAAAEQRWSVTVKLAHRIGELVIGDVAVVAVVGGQHREEAFEACRWTIDEAKRRIPIWKRERYVDGSEAWVDPTTASGATPAEKLR